MSRASTHHRFRWRWFWAVFVLVLAAYASLAVWMHYEASRWTMRAQPFLGTALSFRGAGPQAVVDKIGTPSSSTRRGSELVLTYRPPSYPADLELYFLNDRPSDWAISFPWYVHPGVRSSLNRLSYTAMAIGFLLWLALAVAACFYHRYTRVVSHLLLATACFIIVAGVVAKPGSPGPWFLGLVCLVVGVFAIVMSHRNREADSAPVCDECGYNLTGNVSGVCPECGTPVPAETKEELASRDRPSDERATFAD